MKYFRNYPLLLLLIMAMPAFGEETFKSYATVVDVQPIMQKTYETVSRQVCNPPDSRIHLSLPLAESIGEDIRRQNQAWQAQLSCTMVTEKRPRQQISAYRVTYRYGKQTKTTQLSYNPGKRMEINVRVSPLP